MSQSDTGAYGPTTDKSDGIEQTLRALITGSDLGVGRRGAVIAQAVADTDADLATVTETLTRLEREDVVTSEGSCLRWEGER
mgnify:CR=1 FL=1